MSGWAAIKSRARFTLAINHCRLGFVEVVAGWGGLESTRMVYSMSGDDGAAQLQCWIGGAVENPGRAVWR
jgi:hypothetical protein